MYANEDDDFWNSDARPKSADQSETQTKKITYSSSSDEEDRENNQKGLRKSKHVKDEKNAKEQIGEHHRTDEDDINKPDKAAIYDKLFQNLDRLKPRRFDESKLLEDQSSEDADDNGNDHQQTFSTKNKSGGLKGNHKDDSSSSSSDSDRESEAHSSASSTRRKHVSRRKSQEQESSSDRKDRETLKENNGCQDHESAKRDYNRGNQTSEDEKHSGNENGKKSKMKLSKKRGKAKKERSPSLSHSDRDLSSFLQIKNQHQFNAFDKSTKENICKWVKENNQLARKKRDEKRRADRRKKSDAEEDTKSPDRTSKKPKKRRKIPAAVRPRSSSDPGEERSRDAGVPRRSRSQPRTRKELFRSGEFDWSTSKNDEIQSWLKEKTRLLRRKRAEEKKRRRMERRKKEEKQRQRDEKFADSSERVSEWMKQKMEEERLKRKKQKEEILREKERQEQRSTRKSADYHKLRPNNNLNPSFGLRAKEHATKRQELPLLKQREKQRQMVLRNSAKRLDATSSIIQLGKEDERRQFPSQSNSEKLEEIAVRNETGIPNLPSPPARIHSAAKPGEQYPVRRSISLSRIRIPKENEKGNDGQTKLKKKITFDEWLGKKNDDELKRQVLERKKLDADIKAPQNTRVDVTPPTEERPKDIGRPRPKSSRHSRQTSGERGDKAKSSPIVNGNESALKPNPHINNRGADVLGTSLRAKSPKPEVDVRPQSSVVKYQRDSWNGFSDYLWDQVNEQEGGELINSRDMARMQVTGAETGKPKDNQQRMEVKNMEKAEKSSSLFEDKEGHENFHGLNEIITRDLKTETKKSNKTDRITPAHLLGGTAVHRAKKIEAEEEHSSKYSPLELDAGSVKDNGFNSHTEKSDIHTIIDADEEFEPVTDPKQETLHSENLGVGTKSPTGKIATQSVDYEARSKTPGSYHVMRNESNTSDIEEDIVSDFDITGSKGSESSL